MHVLMKAPLAIYSVMGVMCQLLFLFCVTTMKIVIIIFGVAWFFHKDLITSVFKIVFGKSNNLQTEMLNR